MLDIVGALFTYHKSSPYYRHRDVSSSPSLHHRQTSYRRGARGKMSMPQWEHVRAAGMLILSPPLGGLYLWSQGQWPFGNPNTDADDGVSTHVDLAGDDDNDDDHGDGHWFPFESRRSDGSINTAPDGRPPSAGACSDARWEKSWIDLDPDDGDEYGTGSAKWPSCGMPQQPPLQKPVPQRPRPFCGACGTRLGSIYGRSGYGTTSAVERAYDRDAAGRRLSIYRFPRAAPAHPERDAGRDTRTVGNRMDDSDSGWSESTPSDEHHTPSPRPQRAAVGDMSTVERLNRLREAAETTRAEIELIGDGAAQDFDDLIASINDRLR